MRGSVAIQRLHTLMNLQDKVREGKGTLGFEFGGTGTTLENLRGEEDP